MPPSKPNQTAQYLINASFCTYNSAGEAIEGLCVGLAPDKKGGEQCLKKVNQIFLAV